jgi:hypothetical protein
MDVARQPPVRAMLAKLHRLPPPTRATTPSLRASGRVALGSYPPRAPTDPYVLALEHTVPRPTDSPSAMVPEAIRSSYGDMHENLDVFNMFPSIESAGRRFACLHRVLQGEFPCFNGTIKALRLPGAHPTALRYRRLVVPRLHSLFSLPDGRVRRRGLALVARYLRPGCCRGNGRISQVPGESPLSVCACSVDAGRTACTRPLQCSSVALGM